LQRQVEQLKQIKPEELRKRWHALFGANPPPRIRSSLMVQAIARRLQEKALGGLKPLTQRLLQRVAEDAGAGRKVSATAKKIQPRTGTVLVREWHGSKHQVSVLKDGSLSLEAVWFAVADRADHHRHAMVRAVVLRAKISKRAGSWSRLSRRRCA